MKRFFWGLVLAIGLCGVATAQINIVEVQRNTSCRDNYSEAELGDVSLETGPWLSEISLVSVGTVQSFQDSDIQVEGSTLSASGSLHTSIVSNEESCTDYLTCDSFFVLTIEVAEESEYSFSGALADHVELHFALPSGNTLIETPGDFSFSGTIEAGDFLGVWISVSQDERIDGIWASEGSMDFQLEVLPADQVGSDLVSWDLIRSLYR